MWQDELRQRREEERMQRRREKVPPLHHVRPVWVLYVAPSMCHCYVAFSPELNQRHKKMVNLKPLVILLPLEVLLAYGRLALQCASFFSFLDHASGSLALVCAGVL